MPGKVLLVYGDSDQFSSVSDYQKYISKIATKEKDPRLKVAVVKDANHFYPSLAMLSDLRRIIDEWMDL